VAAGYLTRHDVSPVPDPQRRLPSLNVEHTHPVWQSSSLEQVSHSSPELHAKRGTTSATSRISHLALDSERATAPLSCPTTGPLYRAGTGNSLV